MTNPHTPAKAGEAASELLPCPFCGGACAVTKGYSTAPLPWSDDGGDFHRVYCAGCQSRQLFHKSEAEAIDAWNRRAPSPADRAASAQQAESPGYQRGYDDAIAACAALGWKTTDRAASVGAVSEREAFEAYIRKDCGDLTTFGRGANMHYLNGYVNNAWLGWQARAALATPQALPTPQEPRAVEVWHGDRKVTVYAGDSVLRVGPEARVGEMTEEPHTLDSVQAAFDWLYAPTPQAERSDMERLQLTVKALLDQMHHFAHCDMKLWDESMRNDAQFKSWVQSRARRMLEDHKS